MDNITDGTGTFDGENGPFFLNSTTVLDDDDADTLTGAAARDWFFANLDGLGAHDKITDLKTNEFAEELISVTDCDDSGKKIGNSNTAVEVALTSSSLNGPLTRLLRIHGPAPRGLCVEHGLL